MEPFKTTQVILISRTGGTHEVAMTAVARASALCLSSANLESATWRDWFDQSNMAKIVKQCSLAKIEQAVEELKGDPATEGVRVDLAGLTAVAFPPSTNESRHPILSKARVEGIEKPREVREVRDGARVLVNEALGMTTGKACAQAAHALGLLALELPTFAEREALICSATVHMATVAEMEAVLTSDSRCVPIHDAGHTEIAAGSFTAIATAGE